MRTCVLSEWFAHRLVFCVALAGLVSSGCSREKRLPVVNVDAKLILDDKPYGPATISLSPTKPEAKLPPATGVAAAGGKLDLKSYPDRSGIAPGDYSATLLPDPMKIGTSPVAKPVPVSIKADTKTLDIKMTSTKVKVGAPLGSPPAK